MNVIDAFRLAAFMPGAIRASGGAVVSITGDTTFVANDGGGLGGVWYVCTDQRDRRCPPDEAVHRSVMRLLRWLNNPPLVRMAGQTFLLSHPSPCFAAGAIAAFDATVVIQGNTTFANNAANNVGGETQWRRSDQDETHPTSAKTFVAVELLGG